MNEDAEVVQEDTLRFFPVQLRVCGIRVLLLRVLAFGLRCSLECLC